jgi:hemerythrin
MQLTTLKNTLPLISDLKYIDNQLKELFQLINYDWDCVDCEVNVEVLDKAHTSVSKLIETVRVMKEANREL